jgi:hypothetical protein
VPDEIRTSGLDRRRDLAGWLLTPLVTLVLGPALAVAVLALMALYTDLGTTSDACRAAAAGNRCEEITLGMLGGHAVLFGVLWLLLWLTPWWRGLRTARMALAVVACLVLVAAPLRLAV